MCFNTKLVLRTKQKNKKTTTTKKQQQTNKQTHTKKPQKNKNNNKPNQTPKCKSKSNSLIKRNYRQAGSEQLQQFGSSVHSHPTTGARRVTHEACGPSDVGCAQDTLRRLARSTRQRCLDCIHTNRGQTCRLPIFGMKAFLNFENKGVSKYPEIAPTPIGSCP